MTDAQAPAPAGPPPAPAERTPNWGRRVVFGGVILVALLILSLAGAAFLPRWWSHRIGAQVDGSTSQGIGVGLFYGTVFTLLPLLVLWLTFRRRRSWTVRIVGIVGALLLAAPNLMTLGIVAGGGDAAHAGERTLDVEAPGFRTSTLVGVITAGAIFSAVLWLLISRQRSRRDANALRGELRARDEAPSGETGPE